MGFAGSVVILMRLLIHCEIDGSCCETYCIYLEATTRDSVFSLFQFRVPKYTV